MNNKTEQFIRKAISDDIPRLKEIRNGVKENRLSDPSVVTNTDYEKFVKQDLVWLWEENNVIKGFAAGDPSDGWIWALFVDPVYEGQGIGRALFPFACNSLQEAGYKILTLSTGPDTRAERFYLKDGWIADGKNKKGDTIMKKYL